MPDATAKPRPLLVLDVGGVLLTDPMPILFSRLAQAGERPRETILRFYHANLRNGFWSGSLPEDEFWSRLLCVAGLSAAEARQWRADLLSWQLPLPAVRDLGRWAHDADLEILSNHRSGWVRPALSAAGIPAPASGADSPGLIRRALISEETGLVKPDAGAFLAALEIVPQGGRCLFVDDQPPNVEAAEANGLPAILADPAGRWIAEVDEWLDEGDERLRQDMPA